MSETDIGFIEHVIVTLSFKIHSYGEEFDYDDFYDKLHSGDDIYEWLGDSHPCRGDVKIDLISPSGTTSTLLPYRNYDFINEEGYDDWPFMSVHFWGENPVGTWTLHTTYRSSSGHVAMKDITVTLYGTRDIPSSVLSIPASCHSSCSRGCFGEGPENCDTCKKFRLISTLECVDECPNGTHSVKNYCTLDSDIEEFDTIVCDNQEEIVSSTLAAIIAVGIVLIIVTILAIAAIFIHNKRTRKQLRFRRLSNINTSTISNSI